jgi:hypothetical protein
VVQRLEDLDVLKIMVFIDFLIARNATSLMSYSFTYPWDGFDAAGQLLRGATCATFVSAIFDRFKFSIVDLTSWRVRPIQDAKFRQKIIEHAQMHGYWLAAARLMQEPEGFRLKPWELFGSITHTRYPVKFCQAKKLAKTVNKLMHK